MASYLLFTIDEEVSRKKLNEVFIDLCEILENHGIENFVTEQFIDEPVSNIPTVKPISELDIKNLFTGNQNGETYHNNP